jgi:hypothetical protein
MAGDGPSLKILSLRISNLATNVSGGRRQLCLVPYPIIVMMSNDSRARGGVTVQEGLHG